MDAGMLYGIQEYAGCGVLDAVLPYFTDLGEFGAIWVVVGVCLLFSRKYRFWGVCMLASLACVGLLNELGLKHLVGRIRPYIAEGYATVLANPPTSYSFPSGHAGCAFAAATVISLMPASRGWKAGAWVLASALAFSRLYLFVHYPSDVLVGALLGVAYALIVAKVAKAVQQKRQADAQTSVL